MSLGHVVLLLFLLWLATVVAAVVLLVTQPMTVEMGIITINGIWGTLVAYLIANAAWAASANTTNTTERNPSS